MSIQKIIRLAFLFLMLAATSLCNAFAGDSAKNFVFLGQELGVSTYEQTAKDLGTKATVTDAGIDAVTKGKVLKVSGKLVKKTSMVANFVYDTENKLVGIIITAPAKSAKALFGEIMKGFTQVQGKQNSYQADNGIAEIKKAPQNSHIATIQFTATKHAIDIGELSPSHSALWWSTVAVGTMMLWFILVCLQERIARNAGGGWTSHKLKYLADCIDLPGHKTVSRLSLWWNRLTPLIDAAAAATVWYLVLQLFGTGAAKILPIAPAFFLVGSLLPIVVDLVKLRNLENSAAALGAVIGLLIGVISALLDHKTLVGVAIYGGGGAAIGLIAGLLTVVAGSLAMWVMHVAIMVGRPIAWPIKKTITAVLNMNIRRRFGWCENGRPVLVFGIDGVSHVDGANRSIFVAEPHLRRNGHSEDLGIPKFTYQQLSDRSYVDTALVNAALKVAAMGQVDERYKQPEFQWFTLSTPSGATWTGEEMMPQVLNPTTGLPMVGNTAGGMDVDGNLWAHDTNPATGLQTTGGAGTDDIAGNTYGYDHNINNPM
ncbi:hypothetical protein OL229_04035 [Neisseriaceae bacterium JH1-16]|nr:hypothetical protein [Neisseriaceae bacterium JH1-16]